ncbi:MAG: type II toxin-antitoxin system prevent-host-death family antitoxin [Patescibacteria group bacterium]
MNTIPVMVSASDLQRSSKRVISLAQKNDRVLVLNNNTPQVAIISIKKLEEIMNQNRQWENWDAMEAIRSGEADEKAGKLIKLSPDLHELVDD